MVWFVVDMIRCSCSEPLAEEAVWALQDDVAMEEVVGLYSEVCRLDLQAQAVGASTDGSHYFPAVNRAEPACTGEHEGTGILKRMAEIKAQLEATHGTNSPSLEKAGALTPRSRLRSGSRGGPKVRHAHPCRCLFLPMTLVAAAPRLGQFGLGLRRRGRARAAAVAAPARRCRAALPAARAGGRLAGRRHAPASRPSPFPREAAPRSL